MASNLLKTFEKIERGRKKCIAKANEVNYPLPEDASLDQIARCIDAQGHVSTYLNDYKAMITKDFSSVNNGILRIPADVTRIGYKAFESNTGLKGVIFPDALKEIGMNAFGYCTGLTGHINLPEGLETIEANAFYHAGVSPSTLEGITIPSSVKSIGQSAFRGTRGIINFNANVSVIPNGCFQNSTTTESKTDPFITEFNVPEEVLNNITEIGPYSFQYQRKLKNLPIGPNLKTLGSNAFSYCESIEEHVTIPSSCTAITTSVFEYSEFKGGITINEGPTSIQTYAFRNVCLYQSTLVVPKTVTTIGQDAFYSTVDHYDSDTGAFVNLKRLDILYDETLTLGYGAFQYSRIDEVIIHAKQIKYSNQNGRQFYNSYTHTVVYLNLEKGTTLHTSAFSNSKVSSGGIYIPDDLVDYYKTQSGWSSFASYIKPLTSWPGYEEYMASLEVSE